MPDYERKERAVSELIGAILLVGLVITAMAIVAVLLLSNPPPEEVPQLNALAGNTSDSIYLYHTGGDELNEEQTIIRINNNPDPVPHTAIHLKSEDGTTESSSWDVTRTPWTVGKTLFISSAVIPQGVSIVYQGQTSQNLILTTSFIASSGYSVPTTTGGTVTATTTVTTTTTTSPTPTPTPACGTISGSVFNDTNNNHNWDSGESGLSGWTVGVFTYPQDQLVMIYTSDSQGNYQFSNLSSRRYLIDVDMKSGWEQTYPTWDEGIGGYSGGNDYVVNITQSCYETGKNFGYYRESASPTAKDTLLNSDRGGYVKGGGQISFTVQNSYSRITVGGIQYILNIGDTVSLTVNGDSTNVEIDMNDNQISRFAFPDVTVYRGGTFLNRGSVTYIWISQYNNMASSLSIIVPSHNPVWTRLNFNGNTIINGNNGQKIELYNLYPKTSNAYMRLDVRYNDVYYNGAATGYQLT